MEASRRDGVHGALHLLDRRLQAREVILGDRTEDMAEALLEYDVRVLTRGEGAGVRVPT